MNNNSNHNAAGTATPDQVMQWALEDILDHKQQLSTDIMAMVEPESEVFNIITSLSRVLRDSDEAGLKHAFMALCKKHLWLAALKSKPVPPRPGTEGEQSSQEKDPRFKTGKTGKKVIVRVSEDDIEALPDKEYLIDEILEKATVSMIYGPAGTGKTFNSLHIAYCIAHGVAWFGHKSEKGKVWYINTEGGRGLKPRIAAWRKEYNKGKTSNIEFITWPVHLKEHSQALLDTIEEAEERPSLLIIDNYSMCASGTNQNDQMEVTRTLMVLHEIAQKYGCHCLLVHHSNWTGKVNGSAAFKNHVDTMFDLSRANKESPIILKSEKQRDEAGFADIILELKIVCPYAHPVTGKDITSCVVVQSNAPIIEVLGSKQQKCLDLLADGMTLVEWQKIAKDQLSVSDRTVERYRDLLEEKKLVRREEAQGKHATYWRVWSANSNEGTEDE